MDAKCGLDGAEVRGGSAEEAAQPSLRLHLSEERYQFQEHELRWASAVLFPWALPLVQGANFSRHERTLVNVV